MSGLPPGFIRVSLAVCDDVEKARLFKDYQLMIHVDDIVAVLYVPAKPADVFFGRDMPESERVDLTMRSGCVHSILNITFWGMISIMETARAEWLASQPSNRI